MSTGDPRFEPVRTEGETVLVPDRWKVDFLVSAGELSLFFRELKDNARLMGTRCPSCGSLYFWPRSWCHLCYEDCEWEEMSRGGEITMFGTVSISLSELRREVPFTQGGILLEGARYPVVSLIKVDDPGSLHRGMKVRAEFLPAGERTGRIRDFYFVPAE